MADKEETREERFERQRRQLQKAMLDHQQKLETDPEYRARCTEIREIFNKYLVTFGNDTEE